MRLHLTQRDREILLTLTHRVRVVTLAQAVYWWWGLSTRSEKTALERLDKLAENGFLESRSVSVHPLLPLESPVVCWKPGAAVPALGPAAYRLRNRWKQKPEVTRVLFASRRAANRFGGFGGKLKHRTQVTHDIHVAQIYFQKKAADTTLEERWIGEEVLESKLDEKTPDAVLVDEQSRPALAIEFGGGYDRRRLEHYHNYCKTQRLSYEVW